jgi:hypothetical protein
MAKEQTRCNSLSQSEKAPRRGSRHPSLTSQSQGSSDSSKEKKQKGGSKWRPILHSEYSSDDDVVPHLEAESTVKKYWSARRVKQPPGSVCSDSAAELSANRSTMSEVPTSICTPPRKKRPSIGRHSAKDIFTTTENAVSKEVSYECLSASSSADFTNQTEPSGDFTNHTGTQATDLDIQTISQFDHDTYTINTEHLMPPEKILPDLRSRELSATGKPELTSHETPPLKAWGEDTEDL